MLRLFYIYCFDLNTFSAPIFTIDGKWIKIDLSNSREFSISRFSSTNQSTKQKLVAGPPDPAADSWVDNPNVGNFDPGTKAGQAIIEKITKVLKDKNCLK